VSLVLKVSHRIFADVEGIQVNRVSILILTHDKFPGWDVALVHQVLAPSVVRAQLFQRPDSSHTHLGIVVGQHANHMLDQSSSLLRGVQLAQRNHGSGTNAEIVVL
jgi:hypothetical protein